MPKLLSALPEEVLTARKEYIAVKVAHGICNQLGCNRAVVSGRSACERCLARRCKSQLKIDERNREAKREYARRRDAQRRASLTSSGSQGGKSDG